MGFCVELAANGEEPLRVFTASPSFALILMDLTVSPANLVCDSRLSIRYCRVDSKDRDHRTLTKEFADDCVIINDPNNLWNYNTTGNMWALMKGSASAALPSTTGQMGFRLANFVVFTCL
jgi:hypothetical protein